MLAVLDVRFKYASARSSGLSLAVPGATRDFTTDCQAPADPTVRASVD